MTSIRDQYEQAAQLSKLPKPVVEPMSSSGYINMQLEDNTPMFSKQKTNLIPPDSVTHLAVCNDNLVLAMTSGKLFRINLKKLDSGEEIKYSQPNVKLTNMFLDPLGCHLLLAFAAKSPKEGNPELMYLHNKSSKLKTVSKSKNYEVTEVGWNYENKSESSTGLILLGTSQGHILETDLEAESDRMFTVGQQYWRPIFDIGRGGDIPITGIQFHRINGSNKYFLFVTTPTRLHQFTGSAVVTDGKPSLQNVFNHYLTMPETSFQELPSSLKYSRLQFHFNSSNEPKTFAWLTESGLLYGKLDPTSQQNSNSLFTHADLMTFPVDESCKEKTPLNFVLTEFHALLMYTDRVKAVCLLNQEVVYEEVYSEEYGRLKNIVMDPARRTIWSATDKNIFRTKVVKEDRNIWRIYADQQMFDLAKEHSYNNPALIDVINVKQADLLFSQGEYVKSAEIYSETQSSFETVCLKFLEINHNAALKMYLSNRLNALNEDDNTLIPMLVIWMAELYLSQLGQLRRSGKENSQEFHDLQSDFIVFLLQPKVVKCMKHVKSVIYDLMSSHGDKTNLIKLAIINEDYETVIAQSIYNKSYAEALSTLTDLKKPDLFYQFAPVLMENAPVGTVNALIGQGTRLKPSKLLPAFLSCEKDRVHVDEIVRYLEFMVQNFNLSDKAIHNYLLTLYADYDHDSLMRYLERQGRDIDMINYDAHYALRLCREKNLSRACVLLSALLGLWQGAVELALETDPRVAKEVAAMPDDPEMQRTLWITIAQHVITKNQDLKEAMSLLAECPSILKIEDILPFFSDVVTIDHFREPICQSLQEYNKQIEELKKEVQEATQSAEYVRSSLQAHRERCVRVPAAAVCELCSLALLLRPFCLFPCGHSFHSDCFTTGTQPTLSPAKQKKLRDLQRQLAMLSNIELSAITSTGLSFRDVLRNEIDDIVLNECLFCGEYMINCIDKPFIGDDEWDKVMKEWE